MDFEQVYRKYFNDVFLYISRLSGDLHIAEEITSETFLKALTSINKFRGECDVRVWLFQIAKNTYYTYLKKNKITVPLDDVIPYLDDPNSNIDELIFNKADALRINKILHTIPEPYREVFMWRIFADLSFKQIGQIFQKTDNWACVTFHRSKMMIKQRMEEQGNEE